MTTFHQFRNNHDGMRSIKRGGRSCHFMSALVCGLDVHKDSTYATILNNEGKVINQTRMDNERVLSYLTRFKVNRVAMESSTAVAPLYRQLASKGFEVVVSHLRRLGTLLRLKLKVTV
jgi:hypothetical protein